MIIIFFKVNNMKYWHPHLPFGQHISVSTLVILKNKCMYVYLIFLGSISVRFCFSISCMISLHGLSHGSSSAFRLHSVRTFCFSKLLWFGSSWQWSNRPPKTINSCRSVLHLAEHGFCAHRHNLSKKFHTEW
jgi:hypothetical protein